MYFTVSPLYMDYEVYCRVPIIAALKLQTHDYKVPSIGALYMYYEI